MRIFLRALLAITITVFSAQVTAGDEEGFVSFDISSVDLDVNGTVINPLMLRGRVGVYLFDEPRISLQSQLAYNLSGEEQADYFCDIDPDGCGLHFTLDYFVGLYLGIELPIGTDYYAYAHAGYGSGQLGGELIATQSSPSYALGFGFALPFNMQGFVEYGQWLDSEDLGATAISVGVRFPVARDDR